MLELSRIKDLMNEMNLQTQQVLTLRESTRQFKQMFLSKPSNPHKFLSLFNPPDNHAEICVKVWIALIKKFHNREECSAEERDALDLIFPEDVKEKDGKGKGKDGKGKEKDGKRKGKGKHKEHAHFFTFRQHREQNTMWIYTWCFALCVV